MCASPGIEVSSLCSQGYSIGLIRPLVPCCSVVRQLDAAAPLSPHRCGAKGALADPGQPMAAGFWLVAAGPCLRLFFLVFAASHVPPHLANFTSTPYELPTYLHTHLQLLYSVGGTLTYGVQCMGWEPLGERAIDVI